MLGSEHESLAKKLTQAHGEARETQRRCTALASSFKAVPIQQRHFQEALDGSLKLAADEDPDEEE